MKTTAANAVLKSYTGLGMLALAAIVVGVIYSVIMRYFFNITYTLLEELLTLIFTFTTFWGSGICILSDEHITIDYFYLKINPDIRKYLNIFNYVVVLIVNTVVFYYCFNWIRVAGRMVSNGMRIQYYYIYSIMQIAFGATMICVVIKIISLIKEFKRK